MMVMIDEGAARALCTPRRLLGASIDGGGKVEEASSRIGLCRHSGLQVRRGVRQGGTAVALGVARRFRAHAGASYRLAGDRGGGGICRLATPSCSRGRPGLSGCPAHGPPPRSRRTQGWRGRTSGGAWSASSARAVVSTSARRLPHGEGGVQRARLGRGPPLPASKEPGGNGGRRTARGAWARPAQPHRHSIHQRWPATIARTVTGATTQ